MPDRVARDFANSSSGLVVAPAGCGKTELIALAVATLPNTRQLILTHTHAGVRALKNRLAQHGVPPGRYRVETIAGFSLRWAASYPSLSGLPDIQPEGPAWGTVYPATLQLLGSSTIASSLELSYDGVFVDEYQDCTLPQHEIVLALQQLLPTRVVGDHMQGIFDFAEPTVDFDADLDSFEHLGQLDRPHRWLRSNPELGEWLLEARSVIESGSVPDFSGGPVSQYDQRRIARTCIDVSELVDGSIVVIRKWPNDAHGLAQRLQGEFTSMEEVECRGLLEGAREIEQNNGTARAAAVIDFAARCMTQVSSRLRSVRVAFAEGRIPRIRAGALNAEAVQALILVASTPSLDPVAEALREIQAMDSTSVVYRRELFTEMMRALRLQASEPSASLWDAAWATRDRARQEGRDVELRTISRTLLIKGLEFDHAIVADIGRLSTKEFYVAITRGTRSLSVLT